MSCYGENCIPPGIKALESALPILQLILLIAIIIALIGGIMFPLIIHIIIIIKKKKGLEKELES